PAHRVGVVLARVVADVDRKRVHLSLRNAASTGGVNVPGVDAINARPRHLLRAEPFQAGAGRGLPVVAPVHSPGAKKTPSAREGAEGAQPSFCPLQGRLPWDTV